MTNEEEPRPSFLAIGICWVFQGVAIAQGPGVARWVLSAIAAAVGVAAMWPMFRKARAELAEIWTSDEETK